MLGYQDSNRFAPTRAIFEKKITDSRSSLPRVR